MKGCNLLAPDKAIRTPGGHSFLKAVNNNILLSFYQSAAMSFKRSAAHTSRIKKPPKPPAFKRSSSGTNPYSSLPRRKSVAPRASKPSIPDEDEDFFSDRLDDIGLVQALATDLTLRDVPQAILYIRGKMWAPIPEQRSGMNSTRIAEVLNFRAAMPPIVTVSHLQALLNSATAVEKEVAELVRGGAIRKGEYWGGVYIGSGFGGDGWEEWTRGGCESEVLGCVEGESYGGEV
jgi:hypothetical protein